MPGPCVLAVTFTNKAAGEMRERVLSLLNDPSTMRTPLVATFHSFCVRTAAARWKLARPDCGRVSRGNSPSTTMTTSWRSIKSAYKTWDWMTTFMPYRRRFRASAMPRTSTQRREDWLKNVSDPKAKMLAKIFEVYEDRLLQANALDFDDLLLESVRLLQHDARLRELCNRRYEFLMIDEYQDTNRSQYELMRAADRTPPQRVRGWR